MPIKLPYDAQLDELLLSGVMLNAKQSEEFLEEILEKLDDSCATIKMGSTKEWSTRETIHKKLLKMDFKELACSGFYQGVYGYKEAIFNHQVGSDKKFQGDTYDNYFEIYGLLAEMALEDKNCALAYECNTTYREYSCYKTQDEKAVFATNQFYSKIADVAVKQGDKNTAKNCLKKQLEAYQPKDVYGGFPKDSVERIEAKDRLRKLNKEFNKNILPHYLLEIKNNFVPVHADKLTLKGPGF